MSGPATVAPHDVVPYGVSSGFRQKRHSNLFHYLKEFDLKLKGQQKSNLLTRSLKEVFRKVIDFVNRFFKFQSFFLQLFIGQVAFY